MKISHNSVRQQRGAAAVEFAIVAMLLFVLLFAILEFGRLFYVLNSVQEVTRRAAREAVVRWTNEEDYIKQLALFGSANGLPAGAEITKDNITIDYLNASGSLSSPRPATAADNIAECLSGSARCIAYVRVSVTGATYAPMVSLFSNFRIPIPTSSVIMPAESMGYSG